MGVCLEDLILVYNQIHKVFGQKNQVQNYRKYISNIKYRVSMRH